jgi:Phytanoyl-CoA dioxygenase (PhyH)
VAPKQLTGREVDHFVEHGYVVVKDCFDPGSAKGWVDRAWVRFGYDRDTPAQWVEKRIHLSALESVDARELAPDAWAAAVQLLGGEDRIELPWRWSDGFIANLGVGDDRPWQPPSAEVKGWHKDGDFFRHFLDSPEQGLLTIVLWTDMHHRGGGTFIAPDSVPVVARHLAEHPEGLLPTELDFQALARQCTSFIELTGNAGDVVLMHPYVLHATSQNVIKHGRLITNPPIALREPMHFDRADPGEVSAVERAVLEGLKVDTYDFQRTGEREIVVPDRVLQQQRREAAEAQRLAATGSAPGH